MGIRSLYLSSLDDAVLLQRTKVENFDAVLIKGNARELRPTLIRLTGLAGPGLFPDGSFW